MPSNPGAEFFDIFKTNLSSDMVKGALAWELTIGPSGMTVFMFTEQGASLQRRDKNTSSLEEMDSQGIHVMTIANSIIGVSILAMPFCFKQCGIVLSIVMLIFSSVISRLACHFLLKSAMRARLRTFEFLAYHAFGSLGKFIIEIGMIGFLLGTCIAFFVVMGDLGPQIVAEMVEINITNTLRTSILIALAVFFILPLGLLRNVDSLSGVCTAAIGFYVCLVVKIIAESVPHILSGDWYNNVEYWRVDGVLQCLPIFSMALFCQTQLFEVYQAMPNASLERMNNLIRVAVNICTCVYIFVGVFGYIALSSESFRGNILMSFKPSFMTEIMKIGFVLSVAFSFPLIIFPCRASLFSLLYKPTYTLHESGTIYIPEGKFRLLTILVVGISLIIGILIPNIELVLGLVGSTIGVMICVLFPATCFICMSKKNTNERILAQVMLFIGIIVMVLGTYANLYAMEEVRLSTERVEIIPLNKFADNNINDPKDLMKDITSLKPSIVQETHENKKELKEVIEDETQKVLKEVRHEPPQPVEPDVAAESNFKEMPSKEVPDGSKADIEKNSETKNVMIVKNESSIKKPDNTQPDVNKSEDIKLEVINEKPGHEQRLKPIDVHTEILEIINPEQVDIEAIKKEEKEINQQEKDKQKDALNINLIDELQKQNEMQQHLVEEKKKVLEEIKQRQEALKNEQEQLEISKVKEEKLKAVKEIENIAKQAIESLVGDDNKDSGDIKPNSSDGLNLAIPAKAFIAPNKVVDSNSGNSNAKLVEEVIILKDLNSNKSSFVDPAPLSYQLRLKEKNLNGTPNGTMQQPIKTVIQALLPLPIAKLNQNKKEFNQGNNLINNTGMTQKQNVEIIHTDNEMNDALKENIKSTNQKTDVNIENVDPNVSLPNNNQNKDKNKDDIQVIRRDILSEDNLTRYKRDVNYELCDKADQNKIGETKTDMKDNVQIQTNVDNSEENFETKSDKFDKSLTYNEIIHHSVPISENNINSHNVLQEKVDLSKILHTSFNIQDSKRK